MAPLFFSIGSLSLGLTSNSFMVLFPSKMSLHTIFAADLLYTFSQALGIGDDYMSFIGSALGGPSCCITISTVSPFFCGVFWVLLSSQLLFRNLLCTLSIAYLGYLYLVRASVRCCISLLRSSGPIQTVFALCVRVLITLYLAAT